MAGGICVRGDSPACEKYPAFNMSLEDLQKTMEPSRYVGRSVEQVEQFLSTVVQPILEANKELLGVTAEINV